MPSVPPELSVAVVVPALNEAENISGLLDDCARQSPPAREVVVVDAGSDDGTYELLVRRSVEWQALRVTRCPGAPPGAARNAGIAMTDLHYIATLDAGSRIGPSWLAALSAPLAEAPERVAVGVVVPDADTDFERAAGWFTVRAHKPEDRGGPLSGSFLPPGRNGYCFSKAAWSAVGGYPAALPWGEDKTFLKSLRGTGHEVIVVPEAIVRWRPRGSLRAMYRQYERYGRGDALSGIDRQNEIVTLGLYATGAALATRAWKGSAPATALLACASAGYLAIFTIPARKALGDMAAWAWVPLIRLTVDLAKMKGFLLASLSRPAVKMARADVPARDRR